MDQSQQTFAEELARCLNETDTSIRRLSRLTGISRRTLENWLYGHTVRPRHVEQILAIARALHLPAADTDRLLLSVAHPSLAQLKEESSGQYRDLLADWQLAPNTLRGQRSASLSSQHNLPADVTPFLGRQELCADLVGLIRRPDIRLITVSGLGGVGKTRLALETARSLIGRFDHGVYFIALDNVTSAGAFWEAILIGLRIPNDGANLPRRLVLDYLHDKQILLLLDNFEHLLPFTAEVAQLLSDSQRLTLLITSRQALDLQAEQLFPIGGLSYKEGPESPAYQLYIQTAQRHSLDYVPSPAESIDIQTLVEAVDGLPLAVDLAATWRMVLSPRQVLEHMQGNLQQMHHQALDRPPRHHNLWSLFDYSWQMQKDADRQAALNLGTIRGSFSTDLALAVAGCTPEVIKRLVQSSLVGQTSGSRLTLHPLVRQFLVEQAENAGYCDQDLENHFMEAVLNWTSVQSGQLRQTFNASYYQKLHVEWQHVERAWWLAVSQGAYSLLESCWDLIFYFEARGTFAQGDEFFAATRQQLPVENQHMQARLDEAQAFMATRLLDLPRALKLAKRSLRTLEEQGAALQNGGAGKYDKLILVTAEYALKQAAFSEADKVALREVTAGYLTKFTEITLALHDGVVASNLKDYECATQAYRRALEIGGEEGYVMPILRCFLAIGLRSLGQVGAAREQNRIALHRALELDIYPAVVGTTYELRLLQGDNPTTEQCRVALEQLALEMGSRRTVGHVATVAAAQYLNLGFTRRAQQLTRIGVGMLWGEVDTVERARILSTVAQTYIAFGLIKTAPQLASLLAS